jgi:N-acetylglucosamine-6-phosphate deacetylase
VCFIWMRRRRVYFRVKGFSMQIPGLVDLQVNGYKGVDFSGGELTEESFCGACREIVAGGTTAFLATMITSGREIYERNLGIISRVIAGGEFASVLLGCILRGPLCAVLTVRGGLIVRSGFAGPMLGI